MAAAVSDGLFVVVLTGLPVDLSNTVDRLSKSELLRLGQVFFLDVVAYTNAVKSLSSPSLDRSASTVTGNSL